MKKTKLYLILLLVLPSICLAQLSEQTKTVDGNIFLHQGNITGSVSYVGDVFLFTGGGNDSNNKFIPYQLTSAPTVTLDNTTTRLAELDVTNATCEITVNTNDWSIENYGSINLQLKPNGNTIIFPITVFHEADVTDISLPLPEHTTLILEKRRWETKWHIYSLD